MLTTQCEDRSLNSQHTCENSLLMCVESQHWESRDRQSSGASQPRPVGVLQVQGKTVLKGNVEETWRRPLAYIHTHTPSTGKSSVSLY